jgi:GMP synthase-like glutamine amidotransferase
LLPSLGAELRLAKDCLVRGKPIVGIGLGAAVLATAAGGGADAGPLRFVVETATRVTDDGLLAEMPEEWPVAVYMRDAVVLPPGGQILATNPAGDPMVFSVADNAFGFLGHPGWKTAMVEDLIMEFDETPEDTGQALEQLCLVQGGIAAALTPLMVGLIRLMDLMPREDDD